MPFGYVVATFERLMERVLARLLGEACLFYLDDIIIVRYAFEDYLKKLKSVLDKLRAANLKLSANKCLFITKQVNYLGHVISENGIEMDLGKIAALKYWPNPKDKTFLELCAKYRRFIIEFFVLAKPLLRLTE